MLCFSGDILDLFHYSFFFCRCCSLNVKTKKKFKEKKKKIINETECSIYTADRQTERSAAAPQ